MKGQEFDMCDLPFDGYYAPQVEIKRRPWGCPLSRHHHYQAYGPFGRPDGHPFGTDNQSFGPPADGDRRFGQWGPPKREGDGPAERQFQGPHGFRAPHDGSPQDGANSHNFGGGSWWFGRRGPAETQERPFAGPWGGPGPDQRS